MLESDVSKSDVSKINWIVFIYKERPKEKLKLDLKK